MATATDPAASRGRLPLALRIFLLLALLLSAAVGTAVFFSQQQGARIADRSVQRALTASGALQLEFAQRQLEGVELKIQLIAADPAFVKYIADAQGDRLGFDAGADARSIQDLLTERKEAYGFDIGIVLDPDAEVLARTDRFEAIEENLGDEPFVRDAIDPPGPISGFWRLDGQLYQAASWPLAQGTDLIGFLLLANQVDDRLGQSVGQVSAADIAFLLPLDDGGVQIIGSSFDPEGSELKALRAAVSSDMSGLASAVLNGSALPRIELQLDGAQWVGQLQPLNVDGGPEIGAALQLTSVEQASAGYRAIVNSVALTGLVTLIIALPLSLLLAKASLRPLTEMAKAAKAAVAGDYQARLNVGGKDELADLAQAFDSLLSDLRGERDIESYVTQLSRLMPDPAEEAVQAASPSLLTDSFDSERNQRLLVAVEHRALGSSIDLQTPAEAVVEIDAWSQRLAQRAAQYGGRVVFANGPRLIAAFDAGDDESTLDALGWLSSVWHASPDAAAAFASGELLTGYSAVGDSRFPLAVGLPVRQVEALLADCPSGHVLLTRAMGEALRAMSPPQAVERVKGARSGNVFYGLSAAALDSSLPADRHVDALPKEHSPTLMITPSSSKAVHAGAGATRTPDLRPGASFDDRYRIISVLGSGGMGVVYKARDLDLDDVVAIKTLHPSALMDGEQLERLKSELKLARRITHPNVLRTFDFGEYLGTPYISMEYVRGMTLRQLITQAGRVPYSAALRIARQLCAGLRAAHEVGVLHRDIKPENLILEASGNAKLMDFGIARPIRRSGPGQTEAGMFVGTPHYSAPEQLAGEEVDCRADIYACGVLMCEMFSGTLPYSGSSTVELYVAQMQGPPKPPSASWPEIPPALEALILRCIARDRNQRFADLAALSAELEVLRA
jgi:serine/threonine-protein kinase